VWQFCDSVRTDGAYRSTHGVNSSEIRGLAEAPRSNQRSTKLVPGAAGVNSGSWNCSRFSPGFRS